MGSTLTHRPALLPYQKRWLDDRSPLKIWCASRQVGKSFALALEAVREAVEGKCANLLLSSSERQSRELMRKIRMHLGYMEPRSENTVLPVRETVEEIELPNGSRIISLPANPDTVRGFTGNIFLDEFAFHENARAIWRAMYPAVTRGYKVRVSSTPNGKRNMFYELWGAEGRFSRHRVDIHEAVAEGLAVDIERLRAGVGDTSVWAQEFECQFLDERTALITYELIEACEDEGATMDRPFVPSTGSGLRAHHDDPRGFLTGHPEPVVVRPFGPSTGSGLRAHHDSHPEPVEGYLGVDIGRVHDLTVIWGVERVGDVLWTRMVREMRGEPFRAQREAIEAAMAGGAVRCAVDATGIGAQLAEELRAQFGARVEPVTFTARVKEALAVGVRRRFEERTVRIPRDRAIREDIHAIGRITTVAGNLRYDGASREGGGHADRFWALALALHAAGNGEGPEVSYERVGLRRHGLGVGCW
jgi:phage FluMu gp28-like protein